MTDFFENLLSNGELQEKVAELQAYKDVNEDFKTAWEELKAENNQLKEDIQDIAKLLDIDVDDELNYGFIEFEVKELKAENDRLKEEVKQLEDFVKSSGEIDHINHEYTYKLRTCLQEIKAIVCGNYEIIDPQGRKDILKLINKAEDN